MTQKRTLIADAGATNTKWALLEGARLVGELDTIGANIVQSTPEQVEHLFVSVKSQLELNEKGVDKVYLYGAGCATKMLNRKVEETLSEALGCDDVEVNSDLLGASRALLGDKPGIACILGTGSNSCLYDGQTITDHVPSLGFILGDEGSGASLGKELISGIFKHRISSKIRDKFIEQYRITEADILEAVYRQPRAGAYLGSFVPFIASNISHPDIHELTVREFNRFFLRNVCAYKGYATMPVSFCGSVAHYLIEPLREAAKMRGIEIADVIQSPMNRLIDYHINTNPERKCTNS